MIDGVLGAQHLAVLGVALERHAARARRSRPTSAKILPAILKTAVCGPNGMLELGAVLARARGERRVALRAHRPMRAQVGAHDARGVLVAGQAERVGARRAPAGRPAAHDRLDGRIDLDGHGRERRGIDERVQRVQQLAGGGDEAREVDRAAAAERVAVDLEQLARGSRRRCRRRSRRPAGRGSRAASPAVRRAARARRRWRSSRRRRWARRGARSRSAAGRSARRGSPCAWRRRTAARASPSSRRRSWTASARVSSSTGPSASSPPNTASELVKTRRGALAVRAAGVDERAPAVEVDLERRVEVALGAAAHDGGEMHDRHLGRCRAPRRSSAASRMSPRSTVHVGEVVRRRERGRHVEEDELVLGARRRRRRRAQLGAEHAKSTRDHDSHRPMIAADGCHRRRCRADGLADRRRVRARRPSGHVLRAQSRDGARPRRGGVRDRAAPRPARRAPDDGRRRRRHRRRTTLDAIERCDLVVESVPEDLALKGVVLTPIAAHFPEAVIASNTSSLSIGAIGEACGAPERTVGTHYWNPPLLMPLVEIIAGAQSTARGGRAGARGRRQLRQAAGARAARRARLHLEPAAARAPARGALDRRQRRRHARGGRRGRALRQRAPLGARRPVRGRRARRASAPGSASRASSSRCSRTPTTRATSRARSGPTPSSSRRSPRPATPSSRATCARAEPADGHLPSPATSLRSSGCLRSSSASAATSDGPQRQRPAHDAPVGAVEEAQQLLAVVAAEPRDAELHRALARAAGDRRLLLDRRLAPRQLHLLACHAPLLSLVAGDPEWQAAGVPCPCRGVPEVHQDRGRGGGVR